MRRSLGLLLGIVLGVAVVGRVDAGLLNLPAWFPGGSDGRPSPAAERGTPKASAVAIAPATERAGEPAQTIAVAGIVDGDTLRVADGRQVRLAQVDADEKGACFGSEATAALRKLTEAKTVTLRRPPQGPKTDRYGRTLADVLVDGKSVNEALVREGAAGWYSSYAEEDLDLARRLEDAQAEAIKAARGQWASCERRGSRA